MAKNDDINLHRELRSYAHQYITIETKQEYEQQLRAWNRYFNLVLDAEERALKKHEEALQKIKEKQQAEAQIAALALSLVSGLALSWLSGTVQYLITPRFASKYQTRVSQVVFKDRGPHSSGFFKNVQGDFRWIISSEATHSKTMAKMFGDASANIVQTTVTDPLISTATADSVTRDSKKSFSELTLPYNPDIDVLASLRTKLQNTMSYETDYTVKTLMGLGQRVFDSENFGEFVMKKATERYNIPKDADEKTKEREGKKYIQEMLDNKRKEWSDDWFYYGWDPPVSSIEDMSRTIEREIWGLWILDQEFKQQRYAIYGAINRNGPRSVSWIYDYKGRDGLEFGEPILDRLIDLDVVIARTQDQFESWTRRRVLDNWTKPYDSLVKINDSLDTKDEITAIEKWAKDHPPELLAGGISGTKRTLKPAIRLFQ